MQIAITLQGLWVPKTCFTEASNDRKYITFNCKERVGGHFVLAQRNTRKERSEVLDLNNGCFVLRDPGIGESGQVSDAIRVRRTAHELVVFLHGISTKTNGDNIVLIRYSGPYHIVLVVG